MKNKKPKQNRTKQNKIKIYMTVHGISRLFRFIHIYILLFFVPAVYFTYFVLHEYFINFSGGQFVTALFLHRCLTISIFSLFGTYFDCCWMCCWLLLFSFGFTLRQQQKQQEEEEENKKHILLRANENHSYWWQHTSALHKIHSSAMVFGTYFPNFYLLCFPPTSPTTIYLLSSFSPNFFFFRVFGPLKNINHGKGVWEQVNDVELITEEWERK